MRSSIALNHIADEDVVHFVGLKLTGNALSWFEQLAAGARDTGPHLFEALLNRYNNADNHLTNRATFEKRKFKQGQDDIQSYKTALQKLAAVSFPQPQREAKVREQFINGLPGRLKKKALQRPDNDNVDQLADHLRHIIAIDQYCPAGEAISAFNLMEKREEVTLDTLLHAIVNNKTSIEAQTDLVRKRVDDMDTKMKELQTAPSSVQ